MKFINRNILKVAGLLAIVAVQSSCQKDAFTNANVNQNAPEQVVPANILPAVENAVAFTQGGDLTRFSCLFMQQNVGFSRQAQAYYGYVLTSTDFDSPWGNMYTSVMGNNKDLMEKSDASGYNVYSGISRILMAYSLQLLVDEWGKVPYSQALTGAANTHPVYDDDKALYDTIRNLVDVAIAQLNGNPGGQVPGSDDIIYGGDASKWIKFGHAIKARLYIHQSKGDPAMAANALSEADMSFSSSSENAQFIYGSSETFANPTYQFNSQRADIDYGAGTLVDLMTASNDPRLTIYTDPNYNDVNGVGLGDKFGNINAPVEFITYDELQFIKAEATLRSTGGTIAAAQVIYRDAITQNMQKLGVAQADITSFLAANGTLPNTTAGAIGKVAEQAYFALYLNPEAWTTWRRTGAPALSPIAGTNGVPRRYLYPQNEYSLNAENVPGSTTLYSPKVFWDK